MGQRLKSQQLWLNQTRGSSTHNQIRPRHWDDTKNLNHKLSGKSRVAQKGMKPPLPLHMSIHDLSDTIHISTNNTTELLDSTADNSDAMLVDEVLLALRHWV